MDVPANLAAAGLPAALAMAGLGGAGSSSGWHQEARKRALALPRLLVVDSEGWGKRCGPDGVHGASICAVGRLLLPSLHSNRDSRQVHRGIAAHQGLRVRHAVAVFRKALQTLLANSVTS